MDFDIRAQIHTQSARNRENSISSFVTPGISIGEESDFPSLVPEDPPTSLVGKENIRKDLGLHLEVVTVDLTVEH